MGENLCVYGKDFAECRFSCIFAPMQVKLPQDFVCLMHEHYNAEEVDALCSALDTTEPDVSVRLNPYKFPVEELLACHPELESVPWCFNAFYLPQRPAFTFDPLLHAGAYYVQEAASMYVEEMVRRFASLDRPMLALDLCAAPGGKSTLLHSILPKNSLLISNEPMAKRAQVLSENMQKWTRGLPADAPRSIVTQNYPSAFGTLSGQVDVLLTDVPCSGEGMFRKDEVARQEWSMENVARCQERQREILSDIWHVLKPGGLLVYSTCTFNRFEDEDNVRWICEEFGGECLAERHFLPGRDRGEGFYVAAIGVPGADASCVEASANIGVERSCFWLNSEKNAKRLLAPHVLFDSANMTEQEGSVRVELTYSEALQYLRREALRVEAPRGPVTLCYRGLILGEGKCVGNRINNLYPDAWRIRTTYSSPFSLLPMVDEVSAG